MVEEAVGGTPPGEVGGLVVSEMCYHGNQSKVSLFSFYPFSPVLPVSS